MKRTVTEYQVTPTARAKLRLDAKRHGDDVTGMTDAQLAEAYVQRHGQLPEGAVAGDTRTEGGADGEGADGEGADGEGADGEGADGEGADGEGADGEGAPPPPGANDNALDSHIRKIAREEVAYHNACDPHGLTDEAALIAKILKKLTRNVTVTVKRPDVPDVTRSGAHKDYADILRAVGTGSNVFLVGPAGCGKTTLAEQAAQDLGMAFAMCGAIRQEHKLFGFHDAHGVYQETPFYRAFRDGHLFLMDECDGSSANVLLALNAALANGFCDFPCGMVKRHPNFRVIAAGNTYGRGADRLFVGREQMDGSSLDRFGFWTMDYDEGAEAQWSGNPEWTATVQRYRHAKDKLNVRHIISPRASIEGAKWLAAGFKQEQVEQAWIWKGLDAATVQKVRDNA